MNYEQEIRAWSLSIAVQIKGQSDNLQTYIELAKKIEDYLKELQSPIGSDNRFQQPNT